MLGELFDYAIGGGILTAGHKGPDHSSVNDGQDQPTPLY